MNKKVEVNSNKWRDSSSRRTKKCVGKNVRKKHVGKNIADILNTQKYLNVYNQNF